MASYSFRRHMWILLVLLVLSLSLWLSPLGIAGPALDPGTPHSGLPAPDFTLEQWGADPVRLSEFRGRPVVLNFWATWCRPCRTEMPALDHIMARYEDEGLVVLLINQGDTPDAIRAFLEEVAVSAPVLLDREYTAGDTYRVRALPTTFFIDREGTIQDLTIGGPMTEEYLESRVAALLEPR